jgi:tight adherence protein C
MVEIYLLGVLGLVLFGGGFLALILSVRWLWGSDLSARLETFVVEEETQTRRANTAAIVRSREISGTFLSRTIMPFFRQIGNLLGRLTPAHSMESLKRRLYIAGYPLGIGPREFFGMRIAFMVLGLFLAYIMLRRGINANNLLLGSLFLFWCFLFPIIWLRMMVSTRQDKMRRGLPDALDMLSVCADAGLGFDQSLQRVSEHWTTPIGLELGRVVAEMEMGLSRREALRNLADRLDVSEISSFVSVILQSEQLGMSIADTLHAQAEQMRVERRFRAQEKARTMPIKMLIPLAFMIFPAIIAVILGPALPQIFDLVSTF